MGVSGKGCGNRQTLFYAHGRTDEICRQADRRPSPEQGENFFQPGGAGEEIFRARVQAQTREEVSDIR